MLDKAGVYPNRNYIGAIPPKKINVPLPINEGVTVTEIYCGIDEIIVASVMVSLIEVEGHRIHHLLNTW